MTKLLVGILLVPFCVGTVLGFVLYPEWFLVPAGIVALCLSWAFIE